MAVGRVRFDVGHADEAAVLEQAIVAGIDDDVVERHVLVHGAVVPIRVGRGVEGHLLEVRRRRVVIRQTVVVRVGRQWCVLGRGRAAGVVGNGPGSQLGRRNAQVQSDLLGE